MSKYSGIYSSASRLRPFKVIIGINSAQHYLKTYRTEEEALEAYNNCAFWVSKRFAVDIPLQGPFELQKRYSEDTEYQLADEIPGPTAETQTVLLWAEQTLKPRRDCNFNPTALPSAVLLGIRDLGAQLQVLRVHVNQALDDYTTKLHALQAQLDPELAEQRRLIATLQANSAEFPQYKERNDKIIEEVYAKFPVLRPS